MNILFVCTGNTCRSPMAEGYLKSKAKGDISVRSAGFCEGLAAVSENAALCLEEIGIDIKNHLSSEITTADIAWADRIICMSNSHMAALAMYTDKQKLSVLGGGIPDPYGRDITVYRNCRDAITNAIDKLYKEGFFSEVYVTQIEREHIKEIALLEKTCFSTPWSEETLLESFMAGTKFFVAVSDNKVLGYIGISCILDDGYITNVAVFPEHRSKGIATKLLNRVFGLAADLRLSFVSLEVRQSNINAISLYEKSGFKTEGKRKNFYTCPSEDALIMTKRFE